MTQYDYLFDQQNLFLDLLWCMGAIFVAALIVVAWLGKRL